MLLEWYQCHFKTAAMGPMVYDFIPKMQGVTPDEEAVKSIEMPWKMIHDKLEELLGGAGPFLTGDHMTLADLLIYYDTITS